jgi:succinate dehydrogenase / fumarate reductase, membrane anchor subunit
MAMVNGVMSLSANGLRDWMIQRVTAVIIGVYTLFLLGFILLQPQIDFATWHHLFAHPFMRAFTLLALLSLVAHAWIGLWTVITDYINDLVVRFLVEIIVILALITYFFWGMVILWGYNPWLFQGIYLMW